MSTQTFIGQLTVLHCAACSVPFGVPSAFDAARRGDHKTFYCPAGHANHYPQKSDVEKLRSALEDEKRRAASRLARIDQLKAERDHQEARVRGYKGALAKSKKRQAKGVCPVPGCKRHFVDVERHIASKHPGFIEARGD